MTTPRKHARWMDPLRAKPADVPLSVDQRIRQMWRAGWLAAAIAVQLGLTEYAVTRFLAEWRRTMSGSQKAQIDRQHAEMARIV